MDAGKTVLKCGHDTMRPYCATTGWCEMCCPCPECHPKQVRASIRHSVDVAKRRLAELDKKKAAGTITKAETYERDMTVDCIYRGERILGNHKS